MRNKPTIVALIALLLFFTGSIWLVFQYVAAEKQRDLSDWEARLNIMAESQRASIENWLNELDERLQTLAMNPLTQLYVTQSHDSSESVDDTRRGQRQHLENLVTATARRTGVFTPVEKTSPNNENDVSDGIAIINKDGIIMATRYFQVEKSLLNDILNKVTATGATYISNIYEIDSGVDKVVPRLIMAVPVSKVQSIAANDYSAAIVALINPENGLYKILLKNWLTTVSDESLLVTAGENSIRYLSPMRDGYRVFHQHPIDKSLLASAVESPGNIVSGKDYRGTEVIAIARPITATSMMLVQKIDTREALADSTNHRNFILIIFVMLVFIITLGFILIWKHASSLRLQKATRRLRARAELLNAVGNSINDHIFLLDNDNKLVFINEAFASKYSVEAVDVRGKSLNDIFDSEVASQLLSVISEGGEVDVRDREMRLQMQDCRHDYHVSVVALDHPDYRRSLLYVMHDITELKDAQGRHNRLMIAIISTLTQVIDKHDPHCAHHSMRTREVAVAIARAMELPNDRVELLAMAALLANIGKLLIPAEVLTNVEPLTEEEASMLKLSTTNSVDILKGLEFEGPVIDVVRQKNECLDGSGYPEAISGDELLLESRILSVANAFVAMTSSRAYREGKPVKEVLELLLTEVDKRYDRQVVAALFRVVENNPEWLNWQQVR